MTAVAICIAVLAIGTGSPVSAATPSCTGDPTKILDLTTVTGGAIAGRYAVPATTPTMLVLFGHGYQNNSSSWSGHLKEAAGRGVLALAPDYTGLGSNNRGWPAKAGAQDLINLAKGALQYCPTIHTVAIFGVSMGGNMTGLAVSKNATRGDGSPLFNYWIDVEGATNVTETYMEATAVAPGNAYAAMAKADIEQETGGTITDKPTAYRDITVLAQVQNIATSGLSGIIMVHSVEDGLVPYNQSRELKAALQATSSIPVDFYSVLRRTGDRDPGHDQTTATSDAPDPAGLGIADKDPFSGHAWEGSNTHIVMRSSLNLLWNVLFHGYKPATNESYIDSTPIPESKSTPRATTAHRAGLPVLKF